jgi:formylglycine-generating enzyme required for sulfatase activity
VSSDSDNKFVRNLQIAAAMATIVGLCIAAVALIPAFGQWLIIRESSTSTPPTAMVDSTHTPTVTHLPPVSQIAPETPTASPTPEPTQTLTPTATPAPPLTPGPNLPLPEAQLGDEWVRPTDGMVMVYVPPPSTPFELGSRITAPTAGYWIDKYPVTNAQYQLCIDAGVCEPSRFAADTRFNGADYPVVGVSWFDAADYTAWLNEAISVDLEWVYALPVEAEWEYAAAGESGADYPWGNVIINCEHANTLFCVRGPSEVGSYPAGASWVGALDMAGNVWEWTDSWGDVTETRRVVRGGSWDDVSSRVRVTSRDFHVPVLRDINLGFRVVVRRQAPTTPTPAPRPTPTPLS